MAVRSKHFEVHKHIFVLFVILLSILGTPVVAQPPPTSSLASGNESVIRSLFAAFNRHDVEGLAALYAPDAYLMSSDFSEPRHGPNGVRKTYSELFSELPQVHDEVKRIIVKGDAAAVEFVSTWAAKGNMPAGQLAIGTFFKFKEGKIISDVSYFKVIGDPDMKSHTQTDDDAAIREAIREFAVAFNEGDLQKFMNIFSENFLSMEYGRRTLRGKEALDDWRSHAQEVFAKYNRHLEISTDEIRVSGTMAFERGGVKVVLSPKSGGESTMEEHRFLDVWEKQDGQWKIVQAMSNK